MGGPGSGPRKGSGRNQPTGTRKSTGTKIYGNRVVGALVGMKGVTHSLATKSGKL